MKLRKFENGFSSFWIGVSLPCRSDLQNGGLTRPPFKILSSLILQNLSISSWWDYHLATKRKSDFRRKVLCLKKLKIIIMPMISHYFYRI